DIVPPLKIKKIIIRFKHNTNDFTADGLVQINDFARILQKYPDKRLMVTGYTDSVGHKEYNIKLSEFRANIVKSFLIGNGIKAAQIQERGLGSDNPIENNDTSFGRKMNRRVEVEVYQ
ncbi:MAG: OmpA family protein, partial [Desulfobacteraceae bacterium]|nr:OmpA family protein [Desulfobacteraceae bacterium]